MAVIDLETGLDCSDRPVMLTRLMSDTERIATLVEQSEGHPLTYEQVRAS